VTDRRADANGSRPLRSQQNDGHYVIDSNDNHNQDVKNLFKSAAISASTRPGPLHDFYVARIESGMRPTMARLTLARKIAAITLTMWKKGVSFDPKQLQPQAA